MAAKLLKVFLELDFKLQKNFSKLNCKLLKLESRKLEQKIEALKNLIKLEENF